MRLRDMASVRELVPGMAVMVERTPSGSIHWHSHGGNPLNLHLAATVVSTEEVDDPPEVEAQVRGFGTGSTYRVDLLVDGDRFESTVSGYFICTVVQPHHPVCGDCGEMWPCRDQRTDAAAARMAMELDDVCAHCGKKIGGAHHYSFNDGLTRRKYHLAKKYRADGERCADAYARARAEVAAPP